MISMPSYCCDHCPPIYVSLNLWILQNFTKTDANEHWQKTLTVCVFKIPIFLSNEILLNWCHMNNYETIMSVYLNYQFSWTRAPSGLRTAPGYSQRWRTRPLHPQCCCSSGGSWSGSLWPPRHWPRTRWSSTPPSVCPSVGAHCYRLVFRLYW